MPLARNVQTQNVDYRRHSNHAEELPPDVQTHARGPTHPYYDSTLSVGTACGGDCGGCGVAGVVAFLRRASDFSRLIS